MRLLHSLVPALALLAGSHAVAQTAYPDRPIKMIVPLAAASAVDVAARIVTQKMADNMGQQIVIINQPGASGLIGAEQVATSRAGRLHDRRLQRQHHDHGAQPAVEYALGHPEGFRSRSRSSRPWSGG